MPKKANLKNYTTTVPASKSISEIQDLLIRFGAQNIIMDSDGERIIAIKFTYPFNDMILPFMLSVNIENTTELLWKEYQKSRTYRGRKSRDDFREDAERIAWRLVRDNLHIQLSLLAIQATDFIHIYAGYFVTDTKSNRTLGEQLKSGIFRKQLQESANAKE